ncbi:MAG: DUF6188 family protein [Candidatus Neomicrothrix subdominans]
MDLDIADRIVEEVTSEYAITLGLAGGAQLRIETQCELNEPGRALLVIDPQNLDTDQGLQRTLVGRAVEEATAEVETGSLAVAFEGGTTLRVLPSSDFEAWAVTWPDGVTVVCLPGGGLSRWGAQR